MAEVSDKQVVPAVVIVVSDTGALAPAGSGQPGFGGDVGEGAVAIIPVKMIGGLCAALRIAESGSVYDEQISETVVVVIDESDAAAVQPQPPIFCNRLKGSDVAAIDFRTGEAV